MTIKDKLDKLDKEFDEAYLKHKELQSFGEEVDRIFKEAITEAPPELRTGLANVLEKINSVGSIRTSKYLVNMLDASDAIYALEGKLKEEIAES